MSVRIVERLEMIDIEHQKRKRLAIGKRFLHGAFDRTVEIFAVAEASEGIGQALRIYCLEALLQIVDLGLR
jgi:hypothetical protein